jgi:hypothetical protein
VFAIIAAIIFGLALLLDLLNTNLGAADLFSPMTLLFAGLLCVALHMAGWGHGWAKGYRRGRR